MCSSAVCVFCVYACVCVCVCSVCVVCMCVCMCVCVHVLCVCLCCVRVCVVCVSVLCACLCCVCVCVCVCVRALCMYVCTYMHIHYVYDEYLTHDNTSEVCALLVMTPNQNPYYITKHFADIHIYLIQLWSDSPLTISGILYAISCCLLAIILTRIYHEIMDTPTSIM